MKFFHWFFYSALISYFSFKFKLGCTIIKRPKIIFSCTKGFVLIHEQAEIIIKWNPRLFWWSALIKKKEVSVGDSQTTLDRKRERDGSMDTVRMLTVMCPLSSDTTLWHSSAGLLHVRREKREGTRTIHKQCPLSTVRQQLVGYALTLRRSIQAWTGASHGPAAFIWLVNVYSHHANRRETALGFGQVGNIESSQIKVSKGSVSSRDSRMEIKLNACLSLCFTGALRWGSAPEGRGRLASQGEA